MLNRCISGIEQSTSLPEARNSRAQLRLPHIHCFYLLVVVRLGEGVGLGGVRHVQVYRRRRARAGREFGTPVQEKRTWSNFFAFDA